MKRLKFLSLAATLLFAAQTLDAQKFLEPSYTFSEKKVSYLTMDDGTEMEVYVRSFKREKGLIEEIKVENKEGKKVKIKPEEIKFMYLPQSGWDKFTKAYDFLTDAQKWDNKEIDQGRVAEGYIYFEKATVQVKKEKMTLMMQLLNPSFCSKMRVYHDPFAKETASLGIGGITVAGGDDKSYYVAAGGDPAYKLMKKNYEEEFPKLFGKCDSVKKKFGKDVRWGDFEVHVYEQSSACK
ncbi:MAG: hypothetical protein AAB316_23825 [Bacteroidota bacterium]